MSTTLWDRKTALAVAIAQALTIPAVKGAEITVDSLRDDGDGPNCTLREAVISANSDNAGSSGCADGSGDDVIVFAPSVTGTLQLSGGALQVENTVSIQGPGLSQLHIDAGGNSRHFLSTYGGGSHILTLSGLTLSNGSSSQGGGAIWTNVPLTLNSVQLRYNVANDGGAIAAEFSTLDIRSSFLSSNTAVNNGGALSVSDSQVIINNGYFTGNNAANGGCLDISGGSLTISESSLSGSRVTGSGGCLRSSGSTVSISDTQVSYHETEGSGGAILSQGGSVTLTATRLRRNEAGQGSGYGAGGAIFHSGGTLTLIRSEVSGNTADGAGGINLTTAGATAVLTNSTISGNTGGVAGGIEVRDGTVTLTHATVANNSGSYGAGLYQQGGSVTLNNSLVVDNQGDDCGFFNDGYTQNPMSYQNTIDSDGTCSVTDSGDVGLEPLDSNGGIRTSTHLIAQGGLADGTADAALCLPTDQRGFPRISASCDVGALEFSGVDSPTIQVTTQQDLTADDGQCSLREALAAAGSDTASGLASGECAAGFNEDRISFASSILPGAISAAGGAFVVDSAVTIQGPGVDRLTIDGGGTARLFDVDAPNPSPLEVTISGMTLVGGNATGPSQPVGGGAIYNSESLFLYEALVQGHLSDGNGGAIRSTGPLLVEQVTFAGNESAGGRGGAVSIEGATATFIASTFSANTAALSGGAVYHSGTSLNLQFNTLVSNSAAAAGGLDLQGSATVDSTVVFNSIGGDCQSSTAPSSTLPSWIGDGGCSLGPLMGDPGLDLALADNGGSTPTHNILPGSNLVDQVPEDDCQGSFEQRGRSRSTDGNADGVGDCDIGAVEYTDITGPVAALTAAPNVRARGDTYALTVTYADADGVVDADSFDINDVSIAPGSFMASQVSNVGGAVTYSFTATGGLSNADVGTYTISLNADQVFDGATTGANAAPAGVLGTFELLAGALISDATFVVNQDAAVGTLVGQVVLDDPNNEVPASGGWMIGGGNSAGQYTIDSSGIIRTAQSPLDSTVLTVEINNGPTPLDTAQITINAVDDLIFVDGFEN